MDTKFLEISVAEIDKAIGAHGMWKTRLKGAIAEGKTDINLHDLKQDGKCKFGEWFYGLPRLEGENLIHYNKIKRLHADFHITAHKVATDALNGRKAEADQSIEEGAFKEISTKLVVALLDWKKYLASHQK